MSKNTPREEAYDDGALADSDMCQEAVLASHYGEMMQQKAKEEQQRHAQVMENFDQFKAQRAALNGYHYNT